MMSDLPPAWCSSSSSFDEVVAMFSIKKIIATRCLRQLRECFVFLGLRPVGFAWFLDLDKCYQKPLLQDLHFRTLPKYANSRDTITHWYIQQSYAIKTSSSNSIFPMSSYVARAILTCCRPHFAKRDPSPLNVGLRSGGREFNRGWGPISRFDVH